MSRFNSGPVDMSPVAWFLNQQDQLGAGSVQAAFDGPQSMGEGMVMPPQEFMDASSMMGGPAEAAAGGMTGMQKAGIGAQVGGGVLDALMRMQTRAPAARGAQMRFGRQGPTVAEQFRRG